jgi:hypothetical protein
VLIDCNFDDGSYIVIKEYYVVDGYDGRPKAAKKNFLGGIYFSDLFEK